MKKLRRIVGLVPGTRWLKRRLVRLMPGLATPSRPAFRVPVGSPADRGAPPSAERVAAYGTSPLNHEPDTFVLYRIIGNDLPPRHTPGQSRRNVAFILEHEPHLRDCEKRFVVNRIVDSAEERAVVQLLEEAGARYLHIPFDRKAYGCSPWDIEGVPIEYAPWTARFSELAPDEQGRVLMRLYRYKNNCVMNNNGARNAALREGRRAAKWVLPWDGNCFVSASAWNEIIDAVCSRAELPYFVAPMARVTDATRLLEDGFRPEATEEPQMIFRRDAALEFNPEYFYGRRPKVELLWRLGVPGSWDSWPLEPWDLQCPPHAQEAGAYGYAGWVVRLPSGNAHLEEGGERDDSVLIERGLARIEAVKAFLDDLDEQLSSTTAAGARTLFIPFGSSYTELRGTAIGKRLLETADEALRRGPYSVVDKLTLPPSGNRHDYWHAAPYYWPHPLRLPGLPYVRRDGRRVPGALLYEPLSERYDRTRLQRLLDDTFVLTLAWHVHGDEQYARHAATLVRVWFLEPDTAMNPHLEYAQVRWGHNENKGSNSGIIELKDLYYFLDAVRLLQASGWLSDAEQTSLQNWFGRYLHWLCSAPQGRTERTQATNHGTYYDLQVATIAAFLGEAILVRDTLRDSRSRMLKQFDADGMQPEEMTRTNTAHYCCFNIQGWIYLAQLAEACGEDLWSFQGSDGRGIRRAMEWLLSHLGRPWPYPQIERFDSKRFFPIHHAHAARYGGAAGGGADAVPTVTNIEPLFHPHDGIMPFWQLGSWSVATAVAETAHLEAVGIHEVQA